MVLAVDIGNTNIVVGVINNDKILFIERISTNKIKTELEYALDLKTIMEIHNVSNEDIDGGIISSVVPPLTTTVTLAINKLYHFDPLIVGPDIKKGIEILLDNPSEIGADRVADAVAAVAEYDVPLIIVDMGTASTISVIDRNKNFIGGLIIPGVRTSLDALASRASQLNGISIGDPQDIIGKNTKDCMNNGIIYGNAAMIDGLIDRIEERLGEKATVIATGGLSKLIIPHCKHEILPDGDLLLKGMNLLYKMNN